MTRRRRWFQLAVLSFGVVGLDILTGPYIHFPILFVLPVGLSAWFLGRWPGIGFATALISARVAIVVTLEPSGVPLWATVANAAIRLIVLSGLAVSLASNAEQMRALSVRVRILEGVLPICAFCKKIRRPDGTWEPVEAYISDRTPAKFSHGFCESCSREQYPEVFGPLADEHAEPGAASDPAR